MYSDLDTLLAGVDAERPDVVLTDIRMPPTYSDEGIRAAGRFAESAPGLGVVVLSQHLDPGYAVRLFARGSAGRGYLLKERLGDIAVLVNALREVAAGGSVVDPEVVDVLVRPRSASPLDRLSPGSGRYWRWSRRRRRWRRSPPSPSPGGRGTRIGAAPDGGLTRLWHC